MAILRPKLSQIVLLALEEDLGRGDLTSEACVPGDVPGHAVLQAREDCVFCGGELVREVFAQIDPRVTVQTHAADGTRAKAGAPLQSLVGPARSILGGERVALNFAQRLSGVATLTRRYVDALPPGSRTRIVDTRKTTPGLRSLERQAVRCGGGWNHREDLGSAVLIKDNHIAAAGGVQNAIERARAYAPHSSRIECEVDTLLQLDQALAARADVVLLDNFDDAQIREAVSKIAGRALIEVSGGISLERVPAIAAAGADLISVGALTHSAPSIDLGLDWRAA